MPCYSLEGVVPVIDPTAHVRAGEAAALGDQQQQAAAQAGHRGECPGQHSEHPERHDEGHESQNGAAAAVAPIDSFGRFH